MLIFSFKDVETLLSSCSTLGPLETLASEKWEKEAPSGFTSTIISWRGRGDEEWRACFHIQLGCDRLPTWSSEHPAGSQGIATDVQGTQRVPSPQACPFPNFCLTELCKGDHHHGIEDTVRVSSILFISLLLRKVVKQRKSRALLFPFLCFFHTCRKTIFPVLIRTAPGCTLALTHTLSHTHSHTPLSSLC